MSKSVWVIATMGLVTMLALSLFMFLSLGQFQGFEGSEFVRLSGLIGQQFKADQVGIKVRMKNVPTALVISYSSLQDTKFDVSVQNAEMEQVARFAIKSFKGREQTLLDEIQVTRSETHGRGCFQQTYVAHFTLANPLRRTEGLGIPGASLPPPQR